MFVKKEDEFNKISYFIQVNVEMNQKSGIPIKETKDFVKYCVEEKDLNVIGLMVIPPNDDNEKYFKEVSDLNFNL